MFSKVGLFSELNYLSNISLDPRYATICGYTESELDAVFISELEGLDRGEIRRWYNGYSWLGEDKVYNPWAILNLLDTRKFKAHWFTTGLPTFLYKVMTDRQFTPLDMQNLQVSEDFVSKFDVNDISTVSLLFQTGYLTIAGEHGSGTRTTYTLDYPNAEVRESMSEGFLEYLSDAAFQTVAHAGRMRKLLIANRFEEFAKVLQSVLSGIPHQWYRKKEHWQREAWYAGILYSCLSSTGCQVHAEESTSLGRSDLVVLCEEQVFVFELKVLATSANAENAAADAIRQIRSKGYANKHRLGNQSVFLIGAVFSEDERNMVKILVESD